MEQSLPSPQEIVVVHRTEGAPAGRWDAIEQVAKIASLVAIPVVVALAGWFIQDAVAKRSVSQEYGVGSIDYVRGETPPSFRSRRLFVQ